MIPRGLYPGLLCCLLCVVNASAATTRYVNLSSTNPVAPYISWATAATTIQAAVDASTNGDTVLVTNGVYQTGGRVVAPYLLTNRVVVNKPISVQSVNGPAVTVIQGHQILGSATGDSAVRGVLLANSASLTGFTVAGGATRAGGDFQNEGKGGGVWCDSTNCVVSNCFIISNAACFGGGGIFQGTFNGCAVSGNTTYSISEDYFGAGANDATLNHCTISSNFMTDYGGGASGCILNFCLLQGNVGRVGSAGVYCTFNNCILSNNSGVMGGFAVAYSSTLYNCAVINNSGDGADGCTLNNCTLTRSSRYGAVSSTLNNCIVLSNAVNDGGSTFNFSCTTPLPANGTNNIISDPQLADAFHIYPSSPCRGAGSASYVGGVDLDGEAWANPPSIGCDEYIQGAITGPLAVSFPSPYTYVATNYLTGFTPKISGHFYGIQWDFGDGTTITNAQIVSHAWSNLGDYVVLLRVYNDTFPGGVTASNLVHVLDASQISFCVYSGSTNPVAPYTSWATAATNIQDAVDVANPGSLVLVSNGVYNWGGRNVFLTNGNFGADGAQARLVVSAPLTVKSVNGPSVTVIQGQQAFTGTGKPIHCVYLTNGAVLGGFTLTNGAAQNSHGPPPSNYAGGGVWCEATDAIISNCIVTGCTGSYAGGVFRGTLYDCLLTNNGAGYSGGGATLSVLVRCILAGNSVQSGAGGAAYNSSLYNCVLSGSTAYYGGGAANCILVNSSVVANSATFGGGADSCSNYNSLVYSNSAPNGPNYWGTYSDSVFTNCCTDPLPTNGIGNFTNTPIFVDAANGNYRLQSNSPCINAGSNFYVSNSLDRDGRPRIVGGTVDIGAYEFQGAGIGEFLGWLQQFGLATDGSADYADADQDGMNNWQEWRAGTNPTNALSKLLVLSPAATNANIVVTWQSVTNVTYFLQRATNLNSQPAFLPLATNIAGQSGTTSFTNTNAASSAPLFYRVGVQ